jgi:putative oxidoreductase
MPNMLSSIRTLYGRVAWLISYLRSPLLLAIRLYWGYQFIEDGIGKLSHLGKVTEYFTSLSLPAPGATAFMVGTIELAGGILFALGIGSRLVSLILFLNMTMAYLSVPDDRANFLHIFSKPEDFYGASPYTYWFAALIILILGPGLFSVDWLVGRIWTANKPVVVSENKTTMVR